MTCIIVEDQPPAQRVLKKYIEDMGTLVLKATFSDPIQAMEFLRSEQVDLMFLDIHLPRISGIDLLKTLANPPYVILTTAFADYALESYDFDVVDYLLKPFSFPRFVKAVSRVPAKDKWRQMPTDPIDEGEKRGELFIKSGHEHIRIDLEEVFFIQSDADYTEIILPGKKYLSSEPLRQWTETLDPDKFIQVHKSYIVNVSKVEKVSGNRIYLEGDQVIPIGRAFKDAFVDRFLK